MEEQSKKEKGENSWTGTTFGDGWGGVGEGEGRVGAQMVKEGDVTGGGEHATPCTDGALWDWEPATCVSLLTSVIPHQNSIKRNKNK